jgi:hypothetical protein
VLECVEKAGYTSAFTTMPSYYDSQTIAYECGRFLIESPEMFRKILNWSAEKHWWSQALSNSVRPILKLKNYYT